MRLRARKSPLGASSRSPSRAAVAPTGHLDVARGGRLPARRRGGQAPRTTWRGGSRTRLLRLAVRESVIAAGRRPTPVIDRTYFRSVYFREPGGCCSSSPPTARASRSTSRQPVSGGRPMLPPQHERTRRVIEAAPPLRMPGADPGEVEGSADPLGSTPPRFTHRYPPPEASGAQGGMTLADAPPAPAERGGSAAARPHAAPGSRLLSPRGPVLENGMPRFFRRIAEGVFDLRISRGAPRTWPSSSVAPPAATGWIRSGIVAVGFSNGANIAASLLLRDPGLLRGAVLLAPMVPFEPDSLPDLSGTAVLIGAGRADLIACRPRSSGCRSCSRRAVPR